MNDDNNNDDYDADDDDNMNENNNNDDCDDDHIFLCIYHIIIYNHCSLLGAAVHLFPATLILWASLSPINNIHIHNIIYVVGHTT